MTTWRFFLVISFSFEIFKEGYTKPYNDKHLTINLEIW